MIGGRRVPGLGSGGLVAGGPADRGEVGGIVFVRVAGNGPGGGLPAPDAGDARARGIRPYPRHRGGESAHWFGNAVVCGDDFGEALAQRNETVGIAVVFVDRFDVEGVDGDILFG